MLERGTRQSSSDATVISNDSAINSDRMSFASLEEEDPYLPNLWICDVNLTDDQELAMEHLIAHLNHPRVVSLQATANALNELMPWKAVPENYMSSDTTTHSLSSISSMQLKHPAARVMREFWYIFFDVAKNIPYWHPAQKRLQNLIKKLADLCEADVKVEKKEWMTRERDGPETLASLLPSHMVGALAECFMASATEWMKFAAHLLWQQALDWDNHASDKSGKNSSYIWDWGSPTGVMYGGESGMHMDRWMYWYATFRSIIKRCSELEEAKLVVYYAQVPKTAMDRVMGAPESNTVGGDHSKKSKSEVSGYLTGEDLIARGIAGIRLGNSGTSEYDAVGDVIEGIASLTLEATVFKEEAVSSETTSSKKAEVKTEAVAKGKLVIKSEILD
ncbi:hypothetical protein NEUTE1DRAFT_99495 [Neurospora tetrasperma FGSC 2508]|uniref:Uncharacterized protein n=1 Tax=Neurospora tetrasperma (strain FGSC 2508 / ATCC MYA-4615 / P0657) TaxID=510951 RepID=F8MFU4_NEUT8|nr:uncharacterized protein NEUTE1DRAFT_99495 [Neurospora tetrasperma FGSC 2508]EGO59320.1 hypothetical protein NEUTE1DRAFT_99495 [Neurospora tetrasperma FGSC 2508]EGZ73440.1 hypothetical protein NEUTE2DRAFT_63171 [Neurospora tetrasperma FGSC 2509]